MPKYTASAEVVEVMQEQSRKIEELRSLLRHAIQKNHELSPKGCSPCEAIVKEIGQ